MANRRMLPTRFFKDPDIINLGSKDTQLILIGLVLIADDEGREVAHAGLLGREMDYPETRIEAALTELAGNDLIVLYQAGKHRYYQLTKWDQWQTLGTKKTLSKYPTPPLTGTETTLETAVAEGSRNFPEFPGKILGNSGKSWEIPAKFVPIKVNLIQVNLAVGEEKRTAYQPTENQPENSLSAFPCDGGGSVITKETMIDDLSQVAQVPITSSPKGNHRPFTFTPGFPWGFSWQYPSRVLAPRHVFALEIGVLKRYTSHRFNFFFPVCLPNSTQILIQNPWLRPIAFLQRLPACQAAF